jgi:hypothetical protein
MTQASNDPRAGKDAGANNNIGNSHSVQPATPTTRPWPRDHLRTLPSLSCLPADQLRLLAILDQLGTPLWFARQGGKEFLPPCGWQHLDATGNRERLAHWHPGMALCGRLSPATFGVLDLDTKNGGEIPDAERFLDLAGITPWCVVATPSGGRHYYLPAHPDARDYPAGRDRHFPGLPGAEFYGRTHFLFLPGTSRPKYQGRGYRIISGDEHLARADSGPLWSALARLDAARRQSVAPSSASRHRPYSGPLAGQGGASRAELYATTVLQGEAEKVAATTKGYRSNALYHAALKSGSRTLLTLDQVTDALTDASRVNGHLDDDGAYEITATIRSGFEAGRRNPWPTPANTPEIRSGRSGGRRSA